MINNKFIEADIDDLFSEQEQKLQSVIPTVIPISSLVLSPLAVCIDRLYLLHHDEECNRAEIELLETYLFSLSEKELEQKILSIMPNNAIDISYAGGLVRWLLYAVYVESLKGGMDVSRFRHLFKLVPIWIR